MPLAPFDPRVRDWFLSAFEGPTEIQRQAWPRISQGEHLLLCAPTGTGKTLCAFLWALDRLLTGTWGGGALRVLYVSPLKALGNDIGRNLLVPLNALGAPVRVAIRTGDTPTSERRRMLRQPPEILVTTPESLNLLLSTGGGRALLGGVRTVILDEIHAVAGSKRGTYLMSAVERLVPIAGEFQRLALSATVKPLDLVAAFVGGFDRDGAPRPMGVIESGDRKETEVTVHGLAEPSWPPLIEEFRARAKANRSTLFFVNNRALSERLAHGMNEGESEPLAYSHHGSLSREIRTVVEERLKEGSLRALVATSSLEMGIDIGALDEVVLVQSPKTIHSAVQRTGRAGHAVGEVSRGRIYPTHGRDFLDAAVLVPLIRARESEPIQPVRAPLDVLAQVLVAMCGSGEQDPEELFALLRRCWSYRTLTREAFERVIEMLLGRYEETQVRSLKPRLRQDPRTGRLTARPGALSVVWLSGGVIPDRGYFTVRHAGTGKRIGELDEEYVWEGRVGQHFPLGARVWRIERITRDDVEALPASEIGLKAPFWRAEAWDRDFALCERIALFLEDADGRIEEPAFAERLATHHSMDEGAVTSLLAFLRSQKEQTGAALPHRHHLLVERVGGEEPRLILHAPWGGRILRPLAIALEAALEERHGITLSIFHNDDGLLIQVPEAIDERALFLMVTPTNVDSLIRRRLASTGLFGTRFRENAMRALLLPRSRARARMPLWQSRLRAKRLLASVAGHEEFPLLAETWRTCLEDEFDLPGLRARLEEVAQGAVALSYRRTAHPSPFAGGLAWRNTNQEMYGDDTPLLAGLPLSERILAEALHDESLRPRIPARLVRELEDKLQGRAEGYAPEDEAGWHDLLRERVLLHDAPAGLPAPFHDNLRLAEQDRGWIEGARSGDARLLGRLLGAILAGRGPTTVNALADLLALPAATIEAALEPLIAERAVVAGPLTAESPEREFCDSENLERLLRMTRAAARPTIEALAVERLPLLLATLQGLVSRAERDDEEAKRRRIEPLFGFPIPAPLLESAILPARIADSRPADLDGLFSGSDLVWFGAGRERVALAFLDDLPLFVEATGEETLLPAEGRHDFFDVMGQTGLTSGELTSRLWNACWEGAIRNDSIAALRKGIETRFVASEAMLRRRGAWESSRPLAGSWERIRTEESPDALEALERDRERVRRLLARYGILSRELCAQELAPLRWGRLSRALRLMELSGEIVAGRLLEGVRGLQFASHEAMRLLGAGLDEEAIWWCHAYDPASLCGLDLLPDLPARGSGSWLVYHGSRLVLVLGRNGGRVELRGEPDARYGAIFRNLLRQQGGIDVEECGAAEEAFLLSQGFRREGRTLRLGRWR